MYQAFGVRELTARSSDVHHIPHEVDEARHELTGVCERAGEPPLLGHSVSFDLEEVSCIFAYQPSRFRMMVSTPVMPA